MATAILVPYHLDEHLPALDVPLRPDRTVTTDMSGGDLWARLAVRDEALAEAVRLAPRPLVISGDCTTALGAVAGLQRAGLDPAIVWFDAHGDLQTLETTASGYLGGMPLRVLVGYRPQPLRHDLHPVPEDRVVLVDARELDPPEAEFLRTSEIRHVGVDEVRADQLPGGPIYLHVDLDVIDPGRLPGLRYPAPDGPDAHSVFEAIRRVIASGRVCAINLACTWLPGRGAADAIGDAIEPVLSRWER